MKTDVVDLHSFYAKPIGAMARDLIGARLSELWGDAAGLTVLGFGYAGPFLEPFLGRAGRVLSIMPAAQGVMAWPEGAGGRVCLSDEAHWPLPDASIDRIVLAHGLEEAESPPRLLREIWRVLADDGRLVVAAPNRSGLWAQFDHTPYGHGRPYSRGQLTALLQDCLFAPTAWSQSLHMPPVGLRFMVRSAAAWERAGERLWPAFAGVVMVEAVKELYAVSRAAQAAPVLEPAARAAVRPAPGVGPESRLAARLAKPGGAAQGFGQATRRRSIAPGDVNGQRAAKEPTP